MKRFGDFGHLLALKSTKTTRVGKYISFFNLFIICASLIYDPYCSWFQKYDIWWKTFGNGVSNARS